MTPRQLRREVLDEGVGFEWQPSLFEAPREGFGLWSVAERIREASGEMTVNTAPGRGCRVTVVFPLLQAAAFGSRTGGRRRQDRRLRRMTA